MGSKAAQVGEVQIGCRCGELVAGGRLGAHQNRSAAGILRADHVNIGIAHEPNILSRGWTGMRGAQTQSVIDMGSMRLVACAIAGAGEALEVILPAEMLCLEAEEMTTLVADHAEID